MRAAEILVLRDESPEYTGEDEQSQVSQRDPRGLPPPPWLLRGSRGNTHCVPSEQLGQERGQELLRETALLSTK